MSLFFSYRNSSKFFAGFFLFPRELVTFLPPAVAGLQRKDFPNTGAGRHTGRHFPDAPFKKPGTQGPQ